MVFYRSAPNLQITLSRTANPISRHTRLILHVKEDRSVGQATKRSPYLYPRLV